MYTDVRDKLKINKKQARRIYEILRLKQTPAVSGFNGLVNWRPHQTLITDRVDTAQLSAFTHGSLDSLTR